MEADSDLAHLLANNNPVDEGYLIRTRSLLSAPLQEISEIESQMTALGARLKFLKAKYSKYQSITSPIRNIPNDILQEIFYNCLPSHRNPLLSASEAPILLTRVCSRWRSLAMSSPQLWAQVHITFCDDYLNAPSSLPGAQQPSSSHENTSRQDKAYRVLNTRCDVARDWLGRAGQYPLSISVFYSSTTWDSDPSNLGLATSQEDPTMKLFQLIIDSLPRIGHLELHMPLEIYATLNRMITDTIATSAQSPSFSSLKYLKLQFYFQGSQSPQFGPTLNRVALLNAPCLEKLSVNGPALNFSDLCMPLPSSQLESCPTTQNITYFCSNVALTPAQNAYILKHVPNLMHCKISVKPNGFFIRGAAVTLPDGDAELSSVVVSLPRLLSLTIWEHTNICLDYTAVCQLYASIDAPRLAWINYENQPYQTCYNRTAQGHSAALVPHTEDGHMEEQDNRTSPIIALLQQSTNLKKLTYDPRFFSSSDFRKSLKLTSPTLTHLVFGQEASLRRPRNELGGHLPSPENIGLLEWLSGGDTPRNSEVGASREPVILPHLKFVELTAGLDSDERLLHFIKARLTAASLGECAPLELIRVRFSRTKQIDIEAELAHFIAGLPRELSPRLRLDLDYLPQTPTSMDPLSTSYGADPNDEYWSLSAINEALMPK